MPDPKKLNSYEYIEVSGVEIGSGSHSNSESDPDSELNKGDNQPKFSRLTLSPRYSGSNKSFSQDLPSDNLLRNPTSSEALILQEAEPVDVIEQTNLAPSQHLREYKLFALIFTLLISVGSHYSAHTLGALKAIIKKEMGITNAQYGVLQSTVSLVNTLIPAFGGIFIDRFGTNRGSLLATFLIMLGGITIAFSTNNSSFSLMVVGRIVYGLGSGTIVIIQETILAHWFRGSSLSLVIALQIATARLSSFLSMCTAVPIAEWVGFYGAAFWVSSIVCVLSFVVNAFYCYKIDKIHSKLEEGLLQRLLSKNNFTPKWILLFPALYWVITLDSFILSSGWTSFLHINSEFIKLKFGFNDSLAAWNASISQLLPIFFVPVLGVYIDRYGHRPTILTLSALLFFVCILILGFTHISPTVSMVLLSISLSLGPVALITAIALILPSNILGTGLGLYKSAQNAGATIVDIWVGQLQDNGKKLDSTISDYDNVVYFYLVWNVFAIAIGKVISYMDSKYYHSILSVNQPSRSQSSLQVHDEYEPSINDDRNKPYKFSFSPIKNFRATLPMYAWFSLLLYSWILFAKYLF